MGILNDKRYQPVLFLGLGGNGGKIVNLLAERLKRHPHWSNIQDLTHFLTIDTNRDDLGKLDAIEPSNRFLVSNFDAPEYLLRKFGKLEDPSDLRFTQWWPTEYKARAGGSPGAGQIRIESRLKLWRNLEEDRLGLRKSVEKIVDAMTTRQNPWRDGESQVIRVYVYGSVAGGTGSGGFLPMAYLVRRWIELRRAAWRVEMNAVLSLPTTFASKVQAELQDDIKANGYAALKELEYLTRVLGYEGDVDSVEFHYDPDGPDAAEQKISLRPFAITYLIDQPETISIERYEHAVADASYLLLFSPLLGAQAGVYDNYEKHQRSLALGHFTTSYACFGTSILLFPRQDVLRYASMRYRAKALSRWLTFGGDDPDFRVPWDDPAFLALADEERDRRADDAFERFVRARADDERQDNRPGSFTEIDELRAKGKSFLPQRLHEQFRDLYGRLDSLTTLQPLDAVSVSPQNPTIKRAFDNLRKDYIDSQGRVEAELETRLAELRSGRYLQDFFRMWSAGPLAQRLLLIRELKKRLTPAVPVDPKAAAPEEGVEREDEFEFLFEAAGAIDFDGELLRKSLDEQNRSLAAAATPSMWSQITDRENKGWTSAKRKAVAFVEQVQQDCRDQLKRHFWQRYQTAFAQVASDVLNSFRRVSQIAETQARLAEAEAEAFRVDPGARKDSEVSTFYLDAEVLHDERTAERHWDVLYAHVLDKDVYFDKDRILEILTRAFMPERDSQGRTKIRDANAIVSAVGTDLMLEASTVCSRVLDDQGLDLSSGLDLEQRYSHLVGARRGDERKKHLSALRATGRLDELVREVEEGIVDEGIADRLRRLDQQCVLLGRVEAAGGDVRPAIVKYAGLHERFCTDERRSLQSVLKRSATDLSFVSGWSDRNSLVLYKAKLGLPIFWFRNVEQSLEPAYNKVAASLARSHSYPLHIEAKWEREGLPNLNAVEIRKDQERKLGESAARKDADMRAARLRTFTFSAMFGNVVRQGELLKWCLGATEGDLGKSRREAFDRYFALPTALRDSFEEPNLADFAAKRADRRTLPSVVDGVRRHLAKLQADLGVAYAAQDDAESRFIGDEIDVVKQVLSELGS